MVDGRILKGKVFMLGMGGCWGGGAERSIIMFLSGIFSYCDTKWADVEVRKRRTDDQAF